MIRHKTLTAIAATLVLAMGGNVLAQDRDDRRGPSGYEQRHDERGGRGDRRGADWRNDRQDFRDGRRFDRGGFVQPHIEWRRGGRVPNEYRGRNYVVDDWRQHRLQAPPRGYQWVGVGGDFVLAAIATGLIAQIIANQ
ncbi:MAG: hypothetical protein EOO24_12760 [Comamonadaceae bacterium]|nr:MAG: hypothetical protein EOO24_12760 [Comamonadaceae bacterium]